MNSGCPACRSHNQERDKIQFYTRVLRFAQFSDLLYTMTIKAEIFLFPAYRHWVGNQPKKETYGSTSSVMIPTVQCLDS